MKIHAWMLSDWVFSPAGAKYLGFTDRLLLELVLKSPITSRWQWFDFRAVLAVLCRDFVFGFTWLGNHLWFASKWRGFIVFSTICFCLLNFWLFCDEEAGKFVKNGESDEGGREKREDYSWTSETSWKPKMHQLQQSGGVFILYFYVYFIFCLHLIFVCLFLDAVKMKEGKILLFTCNCRAQFCGIFKELVSFSTLSRLPNRASIFFL